MAYPQAYTRRRRRRSRYRAVTTPAWLTGRRIAAALAALVILPVLVYGARVVMGLSKLTGSNPAQVLGCVVKIKCDSSVATSVSNQQRINVALYGYGGSGHSGAYLTDSIMVVSIQPRQGRPPQVAEISVPRDWLVPINPNGKTYYARINEAYADGMQQGAVNATQYKGNNQGGGKVANATLENLLGIHIDHFVGVDFHAFEAAVDAVGGIDVNVPDSFTDSHYPHGECDQGDCGYMTVHFTAGPQHMDGSRALIYARSRYSKDNPAEASNFGRNKRQQLIVAALKQRVLSVGGIGKLPDLLGALGDHVITDLGISDAEALYDLVKDVDTKSIEHVSIDDNNFVYECGFPRNCSASYEYAHDKTYGALHHYIENLFPEPALLAEHAPITVDDATGAGTGASTRWTSLLGSLGFSTTDGGWTHRSATTHVIDSSGGRDSRTAQWLASYFGVTVESPAPSVAPAAATSPSPEVATTGGITLILGQDSERAWTGNGESYPPDAQAAPSTWAPASAQQTSSARSSGSTTSSSSSSSTPPPSTQTPAPIICLPPACKPHH